MNEHVDQALRWIPLLPLAAAVLSGLWLVFAPRQLPRAAVIALAVGAPIASFVISVAQVFALATTFESGQMFFTDNLYTWISAGDFHAELSFLLDPLSSVMILVVTGVGSLIHIYSVGYMDDDHRDDRGFQRFFVYLNLFTFAMLMLVLGDNLLVMFVGWEGVGLCSYLLIGFWFLDDANAAAGQKAFVVNRIGDFGFLLGIFLLFWSFADAGAPTVEFREMAANIGLLSEKVVALPSWLSFLPGFPSWGLLTLACLCLFLGACGKSAQIPLYVWLPDAMAGPTPVSALIHAATMVTAGVYMVCRMSFAFSLAPGAEATVAWVGAATALFAATIGLAQTDIKKVLAYSTVSQLGYMFIACGVGAFSMGIFHLMTHAFFKGLLFLAAGSVIHAVGGEQDMRKMGGLREKIPWTFWTMTAATFAIAGFPPFAGFFSKDAILFQAYTSPYGSWVYWAIGVFTAFLTSFYMFRQWFLTFFGEYRGEEPHGHGGQGHGDHGHGGIHESPKVMLVPLVILAVLSVCGGWIGSERFEKFLSPVFQSSAAPEISGQAAAIPSAPESSKEGPSEELFTAISVCAAALGFLLAWQLYHRRPQLPQQIAAALGGFYQAVLNKYWVDEVYDATIIEPAVRGSSMVLWRGVDNGLIDGLVNAVGRRSRGVGKVLRLWQSGNIRSYAAWIVLGSIVVIVAMALQGGLR